MSIVPVIVSFDDVRLNDAAEEEPEEDNFEDTLEALKAAPEDVLTAEDLPASAAGEPVKDDSSDESKPFMDSSV